MDTGVCVSKRGTAERLYTLRIPQTPMFAGPLEMLGGIVETRIGLEWPSRRRMAEMESIDRDVDQGCKLRPANIGVWGMRRV